MYLYQASGILRFLVLTVVYSLMKVRSTWPVVFMTTASSVFLIVKVYFYAGDFTSAWDYVMFGELDAFPQLTHRPCLPLRMHHPCRRRCPVGRLNSATLVSN